MELLSYLLKSSLCLGGFVGLYAALLRRETFYDAARGYFALALVVSMGLPLVEVPNWSSGAEPGTSFVASRYLPDLSFRFGRPSSVADAPTPGTSSADGSLEMVLLLSYGLGVGILLLRLGYQLVGLARLRYHARPAWALGQRVWVPEGSTPPFSFFGWIFLDPARYPGTELDAILRHERVHVQQRHSLDVLAAELLTIGFWFNPAAWLFRVYLKQNLEFLADHHTLQSGLEPRRYQYALLKWGGVPVPLPGTNGFAVPQLKNRIRQINAPASARWRVLKFALTLPLVGVLGMGFAVKESAVIEQIGVSSTSPFGETRPIRSDSLPNRPRKAALTDTEEAKSIGKPSLMGFGADGKVFFSPDSGGVKQIDLELDEQRSVRIREDGRNSLRLQGNPQPLIVLDGFVLLEGTRLESIEAVNVLNVDVFKSGHPVALDYGERGKNGVVKVTTRENAVQHDTLLPRTLPEVRIKHLEESRSEFAKLKEENVVFLVDGVEVKNFEMVEPNQIEVIEVMKGPKTTERYGERARDGIILVRLKKK